MAVQLGDGSYAIYVLGGYDGTYLDSVEYARVSPDGTFSGWSTTEPMRRTRQEFGVAAAGGYLYALGGVTPDDSEGIVE